MRSPASLQLRWICRTASLALTGASLSGKPCGLSNNYERAQEVWQVYSQCALKKEAIALAKQLKKNGFAPKLRIKCGGDELHA